MPQCAICGCETTNEVACSWHIQENRTWKSLNYSRKKRGLPPYTWQEYENRPRKYKKDWKRPLSPSMATAADMAGPTVTWDGSDSSPCLSCEHGHKDHNRWGCVRCEERFKFTTSGGELFVNSGYSNMILSLDAGHYQSGADGAL